MNLEKLIMNDFIKQEIKSEVAAGKVNKLLISSYLKSMNFKKLNFENFTDLIKLSIGYPYTKKREILKEQGITETNLTKIDQIMKIFNESLPAESSYFDTTSKISKNALLAIQINRNKIIDDVKTESFLKEFIYLLKDLLDKDDLSIEKARRLYEKHLNGDIFPKFINANTLCAILYAVRPDVFPLTNSYIIQPLESIIGKFDNSPESYIKIATNLDLIANKISKDQKHFGAVDRVLAAMVELNENIDLVKDTEIYRDESDIQSKLPLNQILFGPAGTGKTYNTINHAMAIINSFSKEKFESETREELKDRFDRFVDNNQIRFVTFHQSFSYEDFVEGVMAETKDDQLIYSVKPGVFKQICDDARLPSFNSLVGKKFGSDYTINRISKDLIEIKKKTGNLIHLSRDTADYILKALSEEKIIIDDIKEKKVIEKLGEHPLLEPFIVNGYNGIWATLLPLMLEVTNIKKDKTSKLEPYVLIIDEINRGNISRIFGELITLIETSKRQGASEELSVTLPYSKKEFTVPQNLYIIGTMNSSDRSLTGLDLALRRRFTFVEMQPDASLLEGTVIEGLNVGKLLKVMNDRIEVLLDRDHCIGHAYFMPLTEPGEATVENLKAIFLQQIIPLLQEYFFDDWSKINLVLNKNKMLHSSKIDKNLFNDSNELSYLQDKKIWRLNNDEFDDIDNYINILTSSTKNVISDDLQNAPE